MKPSCLCRSFDLIVVEGVFVTCLFFQASVQTVPKELKNKSIICTPLVHNKGVSCTEEALKIETQKGEAHKMSVVKYEQVPSFQN